MKHKQEIIAVRFTKFPNYIVDNYYLRDMNCSDSKITIFILRQTLGWGKAKAQIPLTTIMHYTKLTKKTVIKAILRLEKLGILEVIRSRGCNTYRIKGEEEVMENQRPQEVEKVYQETEQEDGVKSIPPRCKKYTDKGVKSIPIKRNNIKISRKENNLGIPFGNSASDCVTVYVGDTGQLPFPQVAKSEQKPETKIISFKKAVKNQKRSEDEKRVFSEIYRAFTKARGKFEKGIETKEAVSIWQLIDKAKDRAQDGWEEFIKKVVNHFWLIKSGKVHDDGFLRKQPFLPSALNAGGIWPRVIECFLELNRPQQTWEEIIGAKKPEGLFEGGAQ